VCVAGSGYITEHDGIRIIIEFVKELAKGDLPPLLLWCDAVAPLQSRGSTTYCIARLVTIWYQRPGTTSAAMSTVFGTSTNSKTDELLSDMITKLQAIEAKQDRMGEQLKGLDLLRAKVASLEAVTTEIGATQDTIAGAVERIDRAQLTLNNKVNRLETEQRAAHAGRRQPGGGGPNDADGDTMPISHKLDFPTFDGTGNPLAWLNRCARFFHVRSTPDHKKVALAAFYLTDAAQLWFRRLSSSGAQRRPTFVVGLHAPGQLTLRTATVGQPNRPVGMAVLHWERE
jgi:hypothetical protein